MATFSIDYFNITFTTPSIANSEVNAKTTGVDTDASERSARLKGTFRVPRKLSYHIIAKDENGNKKGIINDFRFLKFGKRLNNFGTAEFDIQVRDSKMSEVISLRRNTIDIYRDEEFSTDLVWSGEQAVRRSNLQSNKNNWSTIYCFDWFEQLRHRFTADEVSYDTIDAGAIAWDLIDTTQTQTNGSFGITEGTIQATTDRDRTYVNQNIMEAIMNLANVQNGFDFEITNEKVFNVYTIKGEDKTDDIVFIYGKNIKSVDIVEDFSNPINRAIVLGEAMEQTSLQRVERNNTTNQATYKVREQIFSELDVSNVNTLQDKGDAALRKFEDPLIKVTFELVKGSSPNITQFGLGDGIRLVIKDGIYDINAQYRVFEWEVEFDSDGTELLSLTLGSFITI